ncbi:methyltransferase-like protein 27 isoform X2 [Lytechinus variegatus]|uniref:methyltransferase-like protein 27 isoform X1 n=1 Tax=Lytechinus variegatus TaxID=7654 RepID=UPI001BB26DAE|nr:methyltransferase-like protein 27 isoform X1 [Lytechinus variegatus]XP_041463511.1 methyltransferase-like protein 27 isoform X2 [Lytechinus variegatus]XP_041463569.1 methyltransferase-like protein 27 isoform X1 [Lytechinus variegatus]XP_041463570.1 methyltransferase-like protein 27 isoform X2 [Lytechinus variegatus]
MKGSTMMNGNGNEMATSEEGSTSCTLKWATDKAGEFLKAANTQALENMYDDIADKYEEITHALECNGARLTANALFGLIPNRDIRVLDVGCGIGMVGKELFDKGYRDIHGVDISAGMLKVLEKKQIYTKLVKARFDPTTPLEYADGYFDVIVSCGVFVPAHLTHTCLPEIFRLLKPGGIFIITTRKNVFDEELGDIKLKSTFAGLIEKGQLQKISHEEIEYLTDAEKKVSGLILTYKML